MTDDQKKLSLAVWPCVDEISLCAEEVVIIRNRRLLSLVAQKMMLDFSGELVRRLPRNRRTLRLAGSPK